MEAFLVGIAAVAGILLGFWLRGADAKAAIAALELSNHELRDAVNRNRSDLERVTADATSRAGFESLAAEREKTLGQIAAERDEMRALLRARTDQDLAQAARVRELETELKNEKEKVAQVEDAKSHLAQHFESLAAEILDKKSKIMAENSQSELGNLLAPLREQINEFREKVEKAQLDSTVGVTKLENLIGTLGGLNQQLADEARNLSTALRGSSKAQGDWGEFILRDLLEKAGLREGDQYSFRESFKNFESENGNGRSRNDVIVHLPGGRHLVIDTKLSLNAFTDSVNAVSEADREAAMREHIVSVRNHMASLAQAGYRNLAGIKAPDFVIMFVPIEPAFLAALQNDSDLWSDAYAKGVLLVGPTTLLYVIRIVSVLWHQDDQNRNVKEVMDHGAVLYTRFTAFVSDMEDLGTSLRSASDSYEGAKKKLCYGRDNLVDQFEKFKQLSARPIQAQFAEPISFNWAAPTPGDRRLSFDSEDRSERPEVFEIKSETNGYHHDRAQELELEEAPYPAS